MINITNYKDINFLRWSNPHIKKYDKVISELKMKFKIKRQYNIVMKELKSLTWINVNNENNYEEKIIKNFDNIEDLLTKKLEKYKTNIKTLERKIKINNDNKNKALNKEFSDCPICYQDNIDNYAITCCGHYFCQPCIKRCMSSYFKCPICRTTLFFKDICFFNKSEYDFVFLEKKRNQIIERSFSDNQDILYLPPLSRGLVRNPYNHSLVINMQNMTGSTEMEFDNFITHERFKTLISNVESNIKEAYDKKLNSIVSFLWYVLKSRRHGNMTEIVVPTTIDDETT